MPRTFVGAVNISGTKQMGLYPGGHHSIRETIHRSAKPSAWVAEASFLAGQEGQLSKQGRGPLGIDGTELWSE